MTVLRFVAPVPLGAALPLVATPWVVPGVVGTLVSLLAGRVAWARRSSPGGRELLALSAAVGWWCLLQVVILQTPSLEGKMLAARIQYLGICATPLAWLWFAAAYTSRRARIPRAGWLLLAAPEVVTLLLVWTNRWHGLVWRDVSLVPAGSFSGLHIEYGVWFRVHALYIYLLILAGTGLLVSSLSQAAHQRRRLAAVVAAPLMPIVANLAYLVGLTPMRWVDLTPSGLAVGGLVLAWSLLRERMLDLPPVARSRILEAVPDGILVMDRGGRVIDMNSAAGALLGVAPGDRLGEPFHAGARHGAAPRVPPPTLAEHGGRMLEVGRTEMAEIPGGATVLIVRDVTEQHRLQRELRHLGDELLRANRELTELANTDEVTGLASRRHFLQLLERELRRAVRYGHPLSLLLVDMDRFKEINDTLGHGTGDAVLRLVGEVVRQGIREVDAAGRLGGDELAIVLPETDAAGAETMARRLLAALEGLSHHTANGVPVSIGASIGAAVVDPSVADVEELLHRADIALYRAKEGGRNQVRSFAEETEGETLVDGGR